MTINLLTGLSKGDFDTLKIRNAAGQMVNILSLLGGGGGGGITTLVAAGGGITITGSGVSRTLTVDLTALATSASVTTLLSNYILANAYNAAMASKIDTLTAGSNVTIAGTGTSRTISSTGGSALALQLDGVAQSGATTLNFVGNNSSFANNVLNISRIAWQDKLVLRYSNAASDKDLTQGASGELMWNGGAMATQTQLATKQNTLVPGTGITITGNTISAAAGASSAWVTANFLSPLNPGTVGVLAGL